MSGDGRKIHSEFVTVSRTLLRCANRCASRNEFLREASRAILQFTGADTLDIWLEEEELHHHWHTVALPKTRAHLTTFENQVVSEESRKLWSRRPRGKTLLEQILSLMDEKFVNSAARTTGGSMWLDNVVLIPFEIDAPNQGFLRLTSTSPPSFTPTQIETYESLAHLLGVVIANRRTRTALAERVKELTCMYRIAQIAAESNLSLDDTLQKIVELLPPAWQYPDIAKARIILENRMFCSAAFAEGPHHLFADIIVQGTKRGRVEVFYTAPTHDRNAIPLLDKLPFLEEERHLIQGLARELSFIIERKQAEAEKVRLQEQIRHADRLATIGQLAAGVAHELNEPLGNILGFAQLISKFAHLSEQTRRDIERIITASLYAREVIKKLMFFSRQTPSRKITVNLNKVVEEVLFFLESRCHKVGIKVIRQLAPEVLVYGDFAQLQQVLVNLVVNAIQAMPEGGTLYVSTAVVQHHACMIVEDTGVGIASEDLKNIFVPFFTTKDVGQGTGLGLSVVHGIISSHGGSVQVDSKPGNGTRFEIRLPIKALTFAEESSDDK